ncbi:hypothetical protein [Cystobacter fuscus]|uniref:hypothetical protein n=1 Tax=Cystobacter fuscus TaxID=43 RepID=UPI0037C16861
MAQREHTDIRGWGADEDPRNRPGVPMLLEPRVRGGAHWQEPERQPPPEVPVLKRASLEELTPVFSTAIPPKGLSGILRSVAYDIPEHYFRHVALLLLADRVDVLESRLRTQPVRALGTVLSLAGGSWLISRLRK